MEFRLPDLGEGMAEAEIVRWLVKEGERVGEDEPLVEVETDKALVQIPSPAAGRLARQGAPEGARLAVGEVLAVIETEAGETDAGERAARAAGTPAAAGAERQAAAEAPAPAPDSPDAGAIVGNLDRPGTLLVEDVPASSPSPRRRAPASPATRRLARELGVDLARLHGTGPGGRVTAEDVRTAAAAARAGAAAARPAAAAAAPMPPLPPAFGQRLPLRGLRRRIAEHMSRAHRLVPQVTHVEEIDVTELVRLRKSLNEWLALERERGGAHGLPERLSYLPFVAAAAVQALRRHPTLNASLDEEREEIVVHPHIHLGIAVDTPDGLLVPVLRHAERMTVADFAARLPALAAGARARTLAPEELRGSTFTITSAGSIGGLFATPIVNHPEVAILGVHRIVARPAVVDGKIEVRDMMYVSLSFDHRVLDGAEAARFTNDLADILSRPAALLWPRPTA
ncbi:MAG: 2-oxo acid dehydrogenase subunit E2 [Clostridia bacterium]|nr:2-oxo acid dehydrogenase subunit E2 [Clostridia bacterium]